jgi:nitrogen fixation/metabolism regulation signal transduction histidine kinase
MDSDPTPHAGSESAHPTPTRPHHIGRNIPFELQLRVLSACIAAPSFLLAAFLLWRANVSATVMATALGSVALLSLIAMGLLVEEIVRPLQTLANVVSALRESDYSFRARGARPLDALGELALEINEFADLLQGQRLTEMEATTLLGHVISSMDAPVLAFDPNHRLRLINPAAENIFHLAERPVLGLSARELQLSGLLEQADRGILILPSKGNPVHWMVRRSSFRQRGIPHILLVLSDVSIALREQERDAWQRLIRVMGHEINNSLTPIKSIAGSLQSIIRKLPQSAEAFEENVFSLERGLIIIENRAESLNRFIQAYRQLAQLPPPARRPCSLHSLIERAVVLETRVQVELLPGPEITMALDSDQIEQLIINLVRNAAEAGLARFPQRTAGSNGDAPHVRVSWRFGPQAVAICIEDNGIGLTNPSNLFVPFYTTKPGGSGIGLALARQICEAHGGALQLANRVDGPGCAAEVRLPLGEAALESPAVTEDVAMPISRQV